MKPEPDNSLVRILQWIAFVFGLVVTACGAWISWSGGWQDAAGVLGGAFIFGGLTLAILAMPKPRWWKD